MIAAKSRKLWSAAVVLIGLAILSLSTLPVFAQEEEADTTAPTFASATTDSGGENVIITFSEDISLPALVTDIATEYHIPLSAFYKAVMSVSVDGHDNLFTTATLSGATLTLRITTPTVKAGQEVKVAYNNVFARYEGAQFVDAAGNAMENFDYQTVTNAAAFPNDGSFVPGAVLSHTETTLVEGDSTTYTVVLPSQPSGDVTVNLINLNSALLSVSPGVLEFTQENWSTPQTVTLTAQQDHDEYDGWTVVGNNRADASAAVTYDVIFRIVVEDDDAE